MYSEERRGGVFKMSNSNQFVNSPNRLFILQILKSDN